MLIIRLDAIGDALALTPLLAALRRRTIPVDLVLQAANAGIFAPHAARHLITSDFQLRSSSRENLAAIERLGEELRVREYTHVLVATEDPGGYRLASVTRAPVRVGFADPLGKPLKSLWTRQLLTRSIYRSASLDRQGPHECEVLFTLAESLIGDEKPTRDLSELRPLVLEREPAPDERIAIQITEKWQRLGIAFEDVVELVRRLSETGVLRMISAQRERAYGEPIAQATGIGVEYFETLAPWKAAIGAAPAIVAPDSGALHVAGTIGTPIVAIFPPARKYALQIARWAPWAAPHRIVRAERDWPARAADALAQLIST